MQQKVVVWRPMYDPIGHRLLEDGGLDVVVVDSSDARKVVAAAKVHGEAEREHTLE